MNDLGEKIKDMMKREDIKINRTSPPYILVNVNKINECIVNTYLLFQSYSRVVKGYVDIPASIVKDGSEGLYKVYKVVVQIIACKNNIIEESWTVVGTTEIKEVEEIVITYKVKE